MDDLGQYKWPPQEGFKVDPITNQAIYIDEKYVLKVGEVIDRYGAESGTFVSPVQKLTDGNLKPYNYDQRALPYVEDPKLYNQYVVKKDMNNLEQIINDLPDSDFKNRISDKFNRLNDPENISTGEIGQAFGSIDTGIQYKLKFSIEELLELKIIDKL